MGMFWATLGKILWASILFPILWTIEHIVALLVIIFAPFLHIIQHLLHAISIPFTFLATKFETLYIFFGTATLLGLLTGLILYGALNIIGPVFGTERKPGEEAPRTAASYRAERAATKARQARERTAMGFTSGLSSDGGVFKVEDSDWMSGHGHGAPTSMMGTMIMEEPSSSE